jgi:hypothetical protein
MDPEPVYNFLLPKDATASPIVEARAETVLMRAS